MADGGNHSLFSDAVQYLMAGGGGVLGRVMYHMHLIQKGERKPWVWFACDLLIALGTGWVVLGICDWLEVGIKLTQSLAIIAGWGGPQLLDKAISRAIDKYFGSDDKT